VNDRLAAALSDRYRIERELGQGGMATVYLAEDLRHKRKVALKVLKPELAAVLGAERFVQEITTTAALQHPHILPLFDSGTADGFLYYVMPFIDGETLRAKLDRETQLGVDEAVRITTDVADALDYAHQQGVIHRDIKPENILLHNGRPMVADFGIALALSAAAGGRMTETGLSLGTPHYMSPEQATAEKEITARSDVYSLGSVLYEMLAGQPPHLGGSAQQIIMKIVTEEAAPVTQHRKSVPLNVAAAVAKALEKLPADRFESARAFADALHDPGFVTTALVAGTGRLPQTRGVRWWIRSPWSWGALAAVVVLATGLGWSLNRPVPTRPVTRIETTLPAESWSQYDLSRDGRRIVSLVGRDSLWIRDLDDLTLRVLPMNGYGPALSADGSLVAFQRAESNKARSLFVMPTEGGSAVLVADSVTGGARWGRDGFLYFVRNATLGRVRSTGGRVETLAVLNLDGGWRTWADILDVLPEGNAALVNATWSDTAAGGGSEASLSPYVTRVVTFDGREPRPLGRMVSAARVLPGGFLTYTEPHDEGSREMVIRFNMKTLQVEGEPVLLVDDASAVRWADDGTAVYRPDQFRWRGVYGTRDGAVQPVPGLERGHWYGPVASPDGSRIAWQHSNGREPTDNIWLTTGLAGAPRPLTFASDSAARDPMGWSPDGALLYFLEQHFDERPGAGQRAPALIALNAGNPSATDTAFTHETLSRFMSIAPDGRTVVWVPRTPDVPVGSSIWRGTIGSAAGTEVLRVPRGMVTSPAISADGRWIAYASTESGEGQVYVQAFPQGGNKMQVTATRTDLQSCACAVFWSRSGHTLYLTRYGSPPELLEARLDLTAGRVVDVTTILRPAYRVFWSAALPDQETFLGATPDLLPGESTRFVILQGMLTEMRRLLEGSQ